MGKEGRSNLSTRNHVIHFGSNANSVDLDSLKIDSTRVRNESKRDLVAPLNFIALSRNWLSSNRGGRVVPVSWNRFENASVKSVKTDGRWREAKSMDRKNVFHSNSKTRMTGVGWMSSARQWADLIYGRWWQKETKRVTNDPANESSGNAFGWISRVEENVHLDVD